MKDKIIIYGGSFDPLHNGHIEIAKAASDYFDAPLMFVPAKNARWKDNSASPEDRFKMIQLVLGDLNKEKERFYVSDYEISKTNDDISYSVDLVEHFAKEYKMLYFIIGADQVNLFDEWKEPERLASLAQIIYVGRPDCVLNEENIVKYNMKLVPFKEHDVSSTDIRALKSIDYPDVIRRYVENNRLYAFKKLMGYLKPSRLEHSISVANVALDISRSNPGITSDLHAYQAGIFHDLGKYVGEKESRELIKRAFSEEYSEYPVWALHQWVGAHIAKETFDIKDEDILNAIQFHCTGRPWMEPLEQIIYSSDKIDPLRGYDSKPLIDSCLKDYHQGFIDVLSANREYLGKKKEKNPYRDDELTQSCYEFFLDKGEKMEYSKLVDETLKFLEERKAEDILVVDVRNRTPFTDYYILVTAPNMRAAGAYAELLEDFLAERVDDLHKAEGEPESGWVLVDAGEIVVHIFTSVKRTETNLEELLLKAKS